MKNVIENLVEYVAADGERVEARPVRLGRFDAVFKIKSGRRAVVRLVCCWLAADGLTAVADIHDLKSFRNFIEFLLDWHMVSRQNRLMVSLCPNRSGAAAEVVTEASTNNPLNRSSIQRGVAQVHSAAAALVVRVRRLRASLKSPWQELAGPAARGCEQRRSSFWIEWTGAIHG